MSRQLDWDDLRFLMALVRGGSARGAGRILAVNHSTVSRRLQNMERKLNCRLVQKVRSKYQLTDAGTKLFAVGYKLETELNTLVFAITDTDDEVAGIVRVSMTTHLLRITAPVFKQLRRKYPALQFEISVSSHVSDIMALESDIALRIQAIEQPEPDLIGKQVGTLTLAIFAAKSSGLTAENIEMTDHPWIRYQSQWKNALVEKWIERNYPDSQIGARVQSDFSVEQLVENGLGLGIMPTQIVESNERLVRVSHVIDELDHHLWVLSHPDLRDVQRIKVVKDAIAKQCAKICPLRH